MMHKDVYIYVLDYENISIIIVKFLTCFSTKAKENQKVLHVNDSKVGYR